MSKSNGTLFCAIAVNDIVKVVLSLISCSLYVDNFNLHCSARSLQDELEHMQSAINQVLQ